MQGDVGVEAVELAAEQGLQLKGVELPLRRLQLLAGLVQQSLGLGPLGLPGQLDQGPGILDARDQGLVWLENGEDLVLLRDEPPGPVGVVPE